MVVRKVGQKVVPRVAETVDWRVALKAEKRAEKKAA